MASGDFSRNTFAPSKRYSGVRLQQGTVFTDADYNAAADIEARDTRRRNLDLIGPYGTSNDGFRVDDVDISAGSINFTLAQGSYYVGGRRVEVFDKPIEFDAQPDWLLQSADDRSVDDTTVLVYLEVWEQIVSAVEDGELLEAALGGPETSTRTRTMYRVHVDPDVADVHCEQAWHDWVERAESGDIAGLGGGEYSGQTGELQSPARLSIDFTGEADSDEDWCTPSRRGGYLGAENHTIRVQLASADRFTWGYDNGGPLYRATGNGDGEITLLTPLRDQSHWPLSGETVEILRPAARLPNGEPVAEASGMFTTVESRWDLDEEQFSVATDGEDGDVAGFFENLDDDEEFFVRIWKRDAVDADKGLLDVTDEPIPLGGTGLTVRFSGTEDVERQGDFWMFSVRPRTRDVVVPWSLELDEDEDPSEGVPPMGVRRFFAPLATIEPEAEDGKLAVHDCRTTFPILPEMPNRTCCTYTVGDGTHSHGDFDSIETAIEHLDADGGKICILAGEYSESIVLDGRRDIHLSGCGSRTVWVGEENAPIITVRNGASKIVVDDMAMHCVHGPGVVAERGEKQQSVAGLRLERLEVLTGHHAAVFVQGAEDVSLHDCDFQAHRTGKYVEFAGPAVFLTGDGLTVEDCTIEAAGKFEAGSTPTGGLQIGGGSHNVRIARNRIVGGTGSGIGLGDVIPTSIDFNKRLLKLFKLSGLDLEEFLEKYAEKLGKRVVSSYDGDDYFVRRSWWDHTPSPYGDDEFRRKTNPSPRIAEEFEIIVESAGPLSDVHIVDNDISSMGGAGIEAMIKYTPKRAPALVWIDRLAIVGNRLRDNAQLPMAPVDSDQARYVTSGGIVLAAVADLRIIDNDIVNNAPPSGLACCGAYALFGQQVQIERNTIVEEHAAAGHGLEHPEGGIYLEYVGDEIPTEVPDALAAWGDHKPGKMNGRTSTDLLVDRNHVDVRRGYALRAVYDGDAVVTHNSLRSASPLWADAEGLPSSKPLDADGKKFDYVNWFASNEHIAGFDEHILAFSITRTEIAQFYDRGPGAVVSMMSRGEAAHYFKMEKRVHDVKHAKKIWHSPVGFFADSSGSLAFHGNRIRLDAPPQEAPQAALFATYLQNVGDTSFQDNYCVYNEHVDVVANAAIGASTIRAIGNRLRRTALGYDAAKFSAITMAQQFNTTRDNQGDHCFYTWAPTLANQVVNGNLTRQPACPYGGPSHREEGEEGDDGFDVDLSDHYGDMLDKILHPKLEAIKEILDSDARLRLDANRTRIHDAIASGTRLEDSVAEEHVSKALVARHLSAIEANLDERERLKAEHIAMGPNEEPLIGHVDRGTRRGRKTLRAEIVDSSGETLASVAVDDNGNFNLGSEEVSRRLAEAEEASKDVILRVVDHDTQEELYREDRLRARGRTPFRDIRVPDAWGR